LHKHLLPPAALPPSNGNPLHSFVFIIMHKFFSLLFLSLSMTLTLAATAQPHPKMKAKRAFSHTSESSRGKNNKAHFRPENGGSRPVIDLNPHKLESFKTIKSPKPYKFRNPK
jgi:hypothetical protein